MQRRQLHIPAVYALVAICLAGAGLGAGLGGGALGGGRVAAAPARQAGAPPFQPITVVSTGPTTSGGIILGGLPVQGDWVGYTLGLMGCGHCRPTVHTIRLRNMVTTQEISISAATYDPNFDQVQGASGIQFAGPYLVWHQPDAVGAPRFTAGTYACALCLYDLRTGQGGPLPPLQGVDPALQGQLLPLAAGPIFAPEHPWRALLLAPPPAAGQPAQLYAANLSTGAAQRLPADLPADAGVQAVAFGPHMAWTIYNPAGPSRLFVYNEGDASARQIAPAQGVFSHLQTNGGLGDLFWSGEGGALYRWRATTGTVDALPGQASSFAVSNGDHLAWTEPAPAPDGPATLRVLELSSGQFILQTPLGRPGADGQVVDGPITGLADDKVTLLSSAFPPGGGPPSDQRLSVAWLLDTHPAFAVQWGVADGGVSGGTAGRSWLWGPAPRFLANEAYAEGPLGGKHLVQYFDKARMEINDPYGTPGDPYFVTNGLLTVEMVSGAFQTGATSSIPAGVPCTIPVVGDARRDNPLTPDYATLAGVASVHGEHQAADRRAQPVADAIDVHGTVSLDAAHGALARYAAFVPQTGHNIPDLFWTYLQGMNRTYGLDWQRVLGYPISEGYWTQMRVGGHDYAVLVQLYQRRVLTYVPAFAPVWRIQQGNAGQHYLEWRYTLNAGRP